MLCYPLRFLAAGSWVRGALIRELELTYRQSLPHTLHHRGIPDGIAGRQQEIEPSVPTAFE